MGPAKLAWWAFTRRRSALLLIIVPTTVLFAIVSLFFTMQKAVQKFGDFDDWDGRTIALRRPGMLAVGKAFTHGDKAMLERTPGISMVSGARELMCATAESGTARAARCYAVDRGYLDIWRDMSKATKEQLDAWERMKDGALITPETAERHGWKVGDRISIPMNDRKLPPVELTVAAIAERGYEFENIWIHPELADEVTKDPYYTIIWMMADRPENREKIMETVVGLFPGQKVLTTSIEGAKSSLVTGSLIIVNAFQGAGIAAILLAFTVSFTILTVSIEERRRQLATLRAMGWRRSYVFRAIVMESILLLAPGAFIGPLAVYFAFGETLPLGAITIDKTIYAPFLALGAGIVIAILGALIPAWRVARADVLTALRDD